jgi:hypothetical protein
MSYDQKKGKSQIGHLTFDHKSFKRKGQMKFDWGMLYIIGQIFSRAIKHFFALSK